MLIHLGLTIFYLATGVLQLAVSLESASPMRPELLEVIDGGSLAG